MSTIRQLLRSRYNNIIKPLFIKDKCERCGSTENLQLHHCTYLCIIINNVLNYLDINEKNSVDEYSEDDVYRITTAVMYEHLKIKYKTLCPECHAKEHEECISDRFNGCGSLYFKNTWNFTDEQIQYLDINLNKIRHGRETLREISKILDCRDEYGRLLDNVDSINEWLETRSNPAYYIETGKERNKNCKKFGCWYYIIRLL